MKRYLLLSVFVIPNGLNYFEAKPLQPEQIVQIVVNKQVQDVVKTIKHNETNNDTKCTKRGLDGEMGCFQILPSTWNSMSKKHYLRPCSKGVNKNGVSFDSCKYVNDGMIYYNSIRAK